MRKRRRSRRSSLREQIASATRFRAEAVHCYHCKLARFFAVVWLLAFAIAAGHAAEPDAWADIQSGTLIADSVGPDTFLRTTDVRAGTPRRESFLPENKL